MIQPDVEPELWEVEIPIDLERADELLEWLNDRLAEDPAERSFLTAFRRDHPRKAHTKVMVLVFNDKEEAALAKTFWS